MNGSDDVTVRELHSLTSIAFADRNLPALTQVTSTASRGSKMRNRCNNCGWFDAWKNLVRETVPASYGYAAYDIMIHPNSDIWGKGCEQYHRPNAKNRARPRCPHCGHGKPSGHGGRRCIATVMSSGYFEPAEADDCGCTYTAPVVSAEGSSLPLSVLVDSHGESAVENNHPVVTPNPAPETETR